MARCGNRQFPTKRALVVTWLGITAAGIAVPALALAHGLPAECADAAVSRRMPARADEESTDRLHPSERALILLTNPPQG
jgi:hypothetical protein